MFQTTAVSHYINKANLTKRITATILDYAIVFGLIYLYFLICSHFIDGAGLPIKVIASLPISLLWFGYFIVTEALCGATLAHKLVRLKVVTVNRDEISFGQAVKRRLFDPVDILFYGVPAVVVILNSEKHQRLGDLWAKTIVVDLSDNEQLTKQLNFPPLIRPQFFLAGKKQAL